MAAQYNMATMYIVYNAEVFKLLLDYFNIRLWHTHTFINDMFTWELYPTVGLHSAMWVLNIAWRGTHVCGWRHVLENSGLQVESGSSAVPPP